jgi:hypothetical protein
MTNPYDARFPLVHPRNDAIGEVKYTLPITPHMCPFSGNPHGGTITVCLFNLRGYPEVAAVAGCARDAMAELVGGFDGADGLPPVRSMEDAIAHIARRISRLFGASVHIAAVLDIHTQHGNLTQHLTGYVMGLDIDMNA